LLLQPVFEPCFLKSLEGFFKARERSQAVFDLARFLVRVEDLAPRLLNLPPHVRLASIQRRILLHEAFEEAGQLLRTL